MFTRFEADKNLIELNWSSGEFYNEMGYEQGEMRVGREVLIELDN